MQASNLIPVAELNQPQLFSDDEFEAGTELVAALVEPPKPDTARRTGRTLERRRGLVKAIIERIGSGMSAHDASKLFGVSRQSIRMLIERAEERGELEPIRKRTAGKYMRVAELSLDESLRRLDEEPEKIPHRDLYMQSGIATDKAQILTGSASKVTVKVSIDQGALAEHLAEVKKAVIDV